jgi:large repetitive protein
VCYGWFIDPTPTDDLEFAAVSGPHSLGAASNSAASRRGDLLTVVMHEMGHLLGYDDTSSDGLMGGFLPIGVRRLAVDVAFATLHQA